jgi:hypothetical protein
MQRIEAMFLPLIVKWVVGEHLLLIIANGVGARTKGGMDRGSEACRLLRGSKSTGDDVGLHSPFLPTKVKERERKTPLF